MDKILKLSKGQTSKEGYPFDAISLHETDKGGFIKTGDEQGFVVYDEILINQEDGDFSRIFEQHVQKGKGLLGLGKDLRMVIGVHAGILDGHGQPGDDPADLLLIIYIGHIMIPFAP